MQDVSGFNLSGMPSRKSLQSRVVWGDRVVTVGGGAPVRIQSMTNTDTVDVIGTAIQVKELANAGSEMVRPIQIPHQPRQRGQRREKRPAIRSDD